MILVSFKCTTGFPEQFFFIIVLLCYSIYPFGEQKLDLMFSLNIIVRLLIVGNTDILDCGSTTSHLGTFLQVFQNVFLFYESLLQFFERLTYQFSKNVDYAYASVLFVLRALFAASSSVCKKTYCCKTETGSHAEWGAFFASAGIFYPSIVNMSRRNTVHTPGTLTNFSATYFTRITFEFLNEY